MRDQKDLFAALSKSRFRVSFSLGTKDEEYFRRRGRPLIMGQAPEFIEHRLAPAEPKNDGRQTPTKGHPIFVAQHATATCCRRCLEKWHFIATGQPLDPSQTDYVLEVLAAWLEEQTIGTQQRSLPGLYLEAEPL